MAGSFANASSQYLSNTVPPLVSTGYPFTVGFWANFASVGATNYTVFAFADTATTNNFFRCRKNTADIIALSVQAGGAEISATVTTAVITGAWTFVIARCINSTNRRIAVLQSSGVIEHQQSVTSAVPTGLDILTIGALKTSAAASNFMDGQIGELWYTNTDIQADGLQLSNDTMYKLAYGGPFCVLHIAKDILEYHSYIDDIIGIEIGHDYVGGISIPNWVNNAGVTVGPNPPLPYWYARPAQIKQKLMV